MHKENESHARVVVVTGASSGIGWETALAFARAGSQVVLAARSEPALRARIDGQPQYQTQLFSVPTDVTRDADVALLVQRTVERHGRIDVLVNNAGVGLRASVADTQPADARRVMEVNFFGALRCLQAVLPVMRAQRTGQIVNVGSVLSALATPRNGIYSASKFALRALSDALRLELQPDGIEVILIMPGYTDTPFFDNLIRYGGPARVSALRGQSPRRVAEVIVRACANHRREVVLTAPGKLGVWLKRFAPRLLDWSLARTHHEP